MRPDETTIAEMTPLLEALCEDRLAPESARRLEQLVLGSPEARWYYVTYLDLHGSLYWNGAGVGSAEALSSESIPVLPWPDAAAADGADETDGAKKEYRRTVGSHSVRAGRQRWILAAWAACAVCVCLAILIGPQIRGKTAGPEVAKVDQPHVRMEPAAPVSTPARRTIGPPIDVAASHTVTGNQATGPSHPVVPPPPEPQREDLDSREVAAAIGEHIRRAWDVAAVRPSAVADDAEWLRRVSLDLLGRIPTLGETESFLANRRPGKRQELVDQLLDDTEFARNFTILWSNLLVGRRDDPHVNRHSLRKFLRMSFAANRPWNQIVYDLVAAEGNNVENGATNFLIAHLNNNALPATAVTARVFLGEQLQCNQCHNNPFDRSLQSEFWELHSFFSQTASVPRQAFDPKTGRPQYSYTELVTKSAGGPIYYETQNGVMRVAFPQFRGQAIDPSPETNRRAMLARLMTEGDQPQLAAAYVNRLWEHFFGRGFTPSADDVGPHTATSHPELLNLLTRQFIRSGYDSRQLIRWICTSEPYQLTSRFGADNRDDDPIEGQMPLFSRMYVKSMTPEQVYDSFLIATKAHLAGGVDWEQAESQRQSWLSQFVVDYENDENDEAMRLDGNLVQALTLMGGRLVEKALEDSPGTFLGELARRRGDDKEKIRDLCLAVLSRPPTASELASMRKLVRQDATQVASRSGSRARSDADGFQDLLWALLNSNEFAVVH